MNEIEVLTDVVIRIKECLRESEKELRSPHFESPNSMKARGEVLGYKTSLECIKRTKEKYNL